MEWLVVCVCLRQGQGNDGTVQHSSFCSQQAAGIIRREAREKCVPAGY